MGLKWEKGHIQSKLGKKALLGGQDSDGAPIYVGRAFHNGAYLPAKILPSKFACYVAYNGVEVFVENFEVLAAKENKFTWEPASDGKIAAGAVSTGKEGNDDEFYIGRAPYQGSMTVGKIHPSHKCLYIPFSGLEVKITNYEVLVYKKPKSKSKLQWLATTAAGPLLRQQVPGGHDTDGAKIYVGRASHEGDMIPCKVIPSKQVAYISHNGKEISKNNFDILIGSDVKWKKEKNGKIPKGAYSGGQTSSGETLYIARGEHNKSLTVGKLQPSHGCLYISYGGGEVALKDYEVLTEN